MIRKFGSIFLYFIKKNKNNICPISPRKGNPQYLGDRYWGIPFCNIYLIPSVPERGIPHYLLPRYLGIPLCNIYLIPLVPERGLLLYLGNRYWGIPLCKMGMASAFLKLDLIPKASLDSHCKTFQQLNSDLSHMKSFK